MDDLPGIAKIVDRFVSLVKKVVEISEDRAEILARGDRAPTADGVETNGDGSLGKQRGRLVGLDFEGVINAKNEKRSSVGSPLAVLPGARASGKFVRAKNVLGPKIARTQTVNTGVQARHLVGRDGRQAISGMVAGNQHGLIEGRTDVTSHGIVAGQGLVRSFENDDIFLSRERLHHGGIRKWANDVQVDGAHLGIPAGPEEVHGGFDIFRSRTQGNKNAVGIFGFILGEQTIVAPGKFAEFRVRLLEKRQYRFREVVPAPRNTLHIVFLILDWAEQHGIRQVNHARNTAALGPEQDALALGRAVDQIVGCAEKQANEFRFVLIKRALEVRGQKTVLHVHSRRQAELGDTAQDQGLVGGLLRILCKDDDPAGIEGAINVVMAAVYIEGVFGQRPCHHFQHHRGALAGSVIVLFNAVDDTLPRGKVHDAFPAYRVRNGTALSRVFSFGLHRQATAPKDIQASFRKGLLVEFSTFGRRRDRVEDAGVGDARFRVVRDELISVGGDPDARKRRRRLHNALSERARATQAIDVP